MIGRGGSSPSRSVSLYAGIFPLSAALDDAATAIVDIGVGTVVGFPTPVLSLLSVVAAAVVRRRALRTGRQQTRHAGAAIRETRA
ncbi:hypothetical protein [Pseudonocardia sp. DLS-67]